MKNIFPDDINEGKLSITQKLHHVHKYIWKNNFSSPIELGAHNNKRVLDIGCGDGAWIIELATENQWNYFTGIDTRLVFPKSIKQFNATFLQADISDNLRFESDTFDLVYVRDVNFIINKNDDDEKSWEEKVLKEMIRVCKPNGWIEAMFYENKFYREGPVGKRLREAFDRYLDSKKMNSIFYTKFEELFYKTDELINFKKEYKEYKLGYSTNRKSNDIINKTYRKISDILIEYIVEMWKTPRISISESMGCTVEEYDDLIGLFKKEVKQKNTYIRYIRIYAQKKE
nr:3145_t:CDS:2 [Entrophospora candida]CAG8551165.1 6117_t:CDS:2 [Entrophospora candida]